VLSSQGRANGFGADDRLISSPLPGYLYFAPLSASRSPRRNIETDPTQPRVLLTELGVGYRLVCADAPAAPVAPVAPAAAVTAADARGRPVAKTSLAPSG